MGWISASYGQSEFHREPSSERRELCLGALKTRAGRDAVRHDQLHHHELCRKRRPKISIDFDGHNDGETDQGHRQVYLPYLDLSITLQKLLGM